MRGRVVAAVKNVVKHARLCDDGLMIKAVFHWEMLQTARRGRGYWLRWLYAVFLLTQIAPIFFFTPQAWAHAW